MEKRDRFLAFVVGAITIFCGYMLDLDYTKIAESGLTLSSIVLAVYIAAIIGLINSDLAKKMQEIVAAPQADRTQLGVLTLYFKIASACALITIFVSSIVLLIPAPSPTEVVFSYVWDVLSVCGLLFYVENLVFLAMIIRFMLNRQIWNK